jgi:hypothetical protein
LPNDGVTFYNIVVFVDILEDHFSETREVFDSDTDKYNVFLEYFDRYVKGGYLARAYEPTSKMFEDELNEAWIHCM